MEDQRAEGIWWENEMRSGRDPSKVCGCPIGKDTVLPHFQSACFRPAQQKDFSDILVEAAAKHFDIQSEEEKCNLKIMFDAYAQCKMRESVVKAFSNLAKDGKSNE